LGCTFCVFFFFFKQKTAYEIQEGDWSSDVCSSDLVMVGDAVKAARLADGLIRRGVYAVSFSYPVVPQDTARIRTQMSAAHSRADLDFAVEQFVAARAELEGE